MKSIVNGLPGFAVLIVMAILNLPSFAADERPDWNPIGAAKYLDDRQTYWFQTAKCISCHTGLPYALARPALHKFADLETPAEQETKLISQIGLRGRHWKELDTEAFGLYYDSPDQMKRQSWGTEAVFNAVISAFDDRYRGLSKPSESAKQAFINLWQAQVADGPQRGSWEWLDFNEPPWGNAEARYLGASLAAIAVGTEFGYQTPKVDADLNAHITLLQEYLKREFPQQNLHNQAWALWASTSLEGILTKAEQQQVIARLLEKQQDDGGWNLPSLGNWVRHDKSTHETGSDGYATGMLLHVLQATGLSKEHVQIAKGLNWLKNHQTASGAWPSVSLIKQRDPESHTGKFMSDAATAFAVLALTHD